MGAGPRGRIRLVVLLSLVVSGCAVQRIENGVYHSSKGYRVTIPDGAWTPVDGSPADLDLRHRASPAGMAVAAVCEGPAPRRALDVLARHQLVGLRDRVVIERGTKEVAGLSAAHAVVEGRLDGAPPRVRVEALVARGGRCAYEFFYVAPPETFEATRGDFARFVDSFRTE